MSLARPSQIWITGYSAVAKQPSQPTSLSPIQQLLFVIAGVLAFLSIGYWMTWKGPDPSQVIRASSSEVPNFPNLSEAETVEKLKAVLLSQRPKYPIKNIELLDGGKLQLKRDSSQNDFKSTRIIPLSQVDRFLYAEQAVKGERSWTIYLYCANMQKCITVSNNRTANDFSLNADGVIGMPPYGDVRQVLGLFNRLLELNNAQSTIDTSKNTIRISQEYWQLSAAEEK